MRKAIYRLPPRSCRRYLQKMDNPELFSNFAQVPWSAALIAHDGTPADDFQIRDLGQLRQDLILHALDEIGIRFIFA